MFPSRAWFARLAARMRADEPAYRDLGPLDCTMVVQIDHDAGDPELYAVAFEDFAVRSIRELDALAGAGPSYFVLRAPLATWREMIENVRENGAPDLQHTLNTLTFPDVPMQVSGPDQLAIDAFYRYNESLQRFFNGAAQVPTTFAA
jgi:hypothetical protein